MVSNIEQGTRFRSIVGGEVSKRQLQKNGVTEGNKNNHHPHRAQKLLHSSHPGEDN